MESNIFKKMIDVLTDRDTMHDRQLKELARNEYKRDWEYAYHSLKSGNGLPGKGHCE